jgi:hypothetical protein
MKKKLYKIYFLVNPSRRWWQFWKPAFVRKRKLLGTIDVEIANRKAKNECR